MVKWLVHFTHILVAWVPAPPKAVSIVLNFEVTVVCGTVVFFVFVLYTQADS